MGWRRWIAAVLAALVLVLSGCAGHTYQDGYEKGYEVGYEEGFAAGEKEAKQEQQLSRSSTRTGGYTAFGTSDREDGYIGNKNTKKFHVPSCSYLPTEANQVEFETREEAIAAGYDPCGHCRP